MNYYYAKKYEEENRKIGVLGYKILDP